MRTIFVSVAWETFGARHKFTAKIRAILTAHGKATKVVIVLCEKKLTNKCMENANRDSCM